MNYYEHHLRDYEAATAHLTWDQDMAYSRLIRWYYRKEKPIPVELAEACRQVRATTRVQQLAVESVLREFFDLREDGWHQDTCDENIAAFQAGEPEREVKKGNEDLRMKRHRQERAELFKQLNAVGQHAPWNTPIKELREIAAGLAGNGTATPAPRTETPPATAPATPATATQTPVPRHQTPDTSTQTPDTSPQQGIGEERDSAPPPAPAAPVAAPKPTRAPPPEGAAATRGSRLSKSWKLPLPWGEWALQEFPHWPPDTIRKIADGFRDHWTGKTGKDATKLDWEATWRNWCRSDITQRQYPAPREPGPATPATDARNAEAKRLLRIANQPQGILDA